jgi:dipeptide/tripeptide permease
VGSESTGGALGMGSAASSAVVSSFSMFVYALPVLWGWMADAKTGRWKLICWGVAVCGIAHIIMVGAGAPSLLQHQKSAAPFFVSVYMLALGAAMFKPNISPVLLDQMPVTVPVTKTLASGEKVIVDPEATTERVMLWFYLLINIGGFMNVATSYCEKLIGWWVAFLIPLILYLPLPFLLIFLRKRLILHPPGGSELGKVVRIVSLSFRRGGFTKLWSGKFFDSVKPSNIARSGRPVVVDWTDEYVEDVKRAFEATAIFSFFPIQFINDNGLGQAANSLSVMLRTNGVPNDVIGNFNSLVIIAANPILNYGLYPLLRKHRIRYGPVARMTTGLMISTLGGVGYAVLNLYAYKLSPCGNYGSTHCVVIKDGQPTLEAAVANISIWWMAIPYALGGLSELFINVPAYGIAYSRSPPNMRGLVSALNLFSVAIAYAIGLIFSGITRDPYLTW